MRKTQLNAKHEPRLNHSNATISILLDVLGRHNLKNTKTVNAIALPTGLRNSAAPITDRPQKLRGTN